MRSVAEHVDQRTVTRGDLTWPRETTEVRSGHRVSRVKVLHLLLWTSQRVINCLCYNSVLLMLQFYWRTISIRLGLDPWSLTFKVNKLWMLVPICMVFFKWIKCFRVCVCFFCMLLAFDELRYWLKSQLYNKFNKQIKINNNNNISCVWRW